MFADSWVDVDSYREFIRTRLAAIKSCLQLDGSIVVHCDKNASHHIRFLLDDVFGADQFRSEIIWTYKRWSNSQRGLTPNHQTLFWYSMSETYTFNEEFGDYSPTTNLDQILQRRTRDTRNKSVYDKDKFGDTIFKGQKKGVPMSDVWDIPFLNPKAKERTGYPTQKPVQLLARLIKLLTDPEDAVLDPFCGSGTTLVAAQELGRNFTGIDLSLDAVTLAKQRLQSPIITYSAVASNGRDSFKVQDDFVIRALGDIEYMPVQRNAGIDGIISGVEQNGMTFIKVQRSDETLIHSVEKLRKAARSRGGGRLLVIQTHLDLIDDSTKYPDVAIIQSASFSLSALKHTMKRSAA